MRQQPNLRLTVVLLTGFLVVPPIADAEAQYELIPALTPEAIEQGNVTPGDAPGFPVTLTEPGKYVLGANLHVPPGVDGIEISADGVTLNLNGFSIIGQPGSGDGIKAPHSLTTVTNGVVRGMGANGLKLGDQARVAGVHTRQNGGVGMSVGRGSIVTDSTAWDNDGDGISAFEGSVISGNTAVKNGGVGIFAVLSTVSGNTAVENDGGGIQTSGSTVSGNTERNP